MTDDDPDETRSRELSREVFEACSGEKVVVIVSALIACMFTVLEEAGSADERRRAVDYIRSQLPRDA